jgi:hypothetical protein
VGDHFGQSEINGLLSGADNLQKQQRQGQNRPRNPENDQGRKGGAVDDSQGKNDNSGMSRQFKVEGD